MERMRKAIDVLVGSEQIRYLFFGGLTTLVNLVVFHVLVDVCAWDVTLGNVISIVAAIVFAFVTNKLYVFRSHTATAQEAAREFLGFVAGRAITMLLEVGGVYLLHNVWGLAAMPAKLIMQAIVIILNYVISKLFVFKAGGQEK